MIIYFILFFIFEQSVIGYFHEGRQIPRSVSGVSPVNQRKKKESVIYRALYQDFHEPLSMNDVDKH